MLGAPGCARSPKENGFDWVLMRLLAGLPVTRDDITGLGVGGLLMEIVTRPQPRTEPTPEKGRRIAAASCWRPGARPAWAGRTSCSPRSAASRWCASPPSRRWPRSAATGDRRHRPSGATRSSSALAGCDVRFVHNPDFADGLATSLKAGIAAVPTDADGAIVCLGDMPQVDAGLIDRLIEAFAPERGALIVVPVIDGRRGNPVLWSRRFFDELMALEGDVGARHLIAKHAEAVVEVPVEGAGRVPRRRHAGGAGSGAAGLMRICSLK